MLSGGAMAKWKKGSFVVLLVLLGVAAAWWWVFARGVASVHDPASLARLLRPHIPPGWQMTVAGPAVRIVRLEPVSIYNSDSLPAFWTDQALLDYVRPNVLRKTFVISLHLGRRMSPEQCRNQKRQNDWAVDRARALKHDPAFMPDNAYWSAHPELGYARVPAFDTGALGIYFQADPYLGPWSFFQPAEEEDCENMLKIVRDTLSK
jgi:hypothetical protein